MRESELPNNCGSRCECLPGGCGASDGGSGETSEGLTEVWNAVAILLVIAGVAVVVAGLTVDCGPVREPTQVIDRANIPDGERSLVK